MGRKLIEMTGQAWGFLTVIERVPSKGPSQWRCVCACGNATIAAGANLRTGNTTSCGCVRLSDKPHRQGQLAGRRFGKLLAVEIRPREHRGNRRWRCVCDCGGTKVVRSDRLVLGETISCGCVNHGPLVAFRPPHVRAKSVAKHSRRKGGGRGPGFTAEQIEALYIKQRERCASCLSRIRRGEFHRDHIHAISRGGAHAIENIQLLCIPRNRRKYNKDPYQFANEQGRLL